MEVEVSVTNYGAVDAKQLPLQLLANGQAVASQFMDLPAGIPQVVHFMMLPNATGQETASGNYNGGVISMDAEGGYVFEFKRVTVEPTVGLSYTHLSQDDFRETGSTSGLQVGDMTMNSFRSTLGARLVARFGREDGVQYLPAFRLVWAHEFADKNAEFNARFIGGGGDFKVRGLELGADTVVVGAGLTVGFNKSVQGFVNYNANLNSRLSSSTFSGGLSYSW